MNRRRFLALSAAAALTPQVLQASATWRGIALGADATIQLSGPQARIERAFAAIPGFIDAIEAEFSLYRPTSALCRLNATGQLSPSPRFARLCQICDDLHRLTGGVFDPSVQPLWQALANGTDLHTARQAIGWPRVMRAEDIRLDKSQALTFNGIAQGFASDLLQAFLRTQGFALGQVDLGEYLAWGGPQSIGISDPLAGMLAQLRIANSALAVSSPRATLIAGQPHILHPKGLPPLWSTVAVEAETAALADGLSTALVFATKAQIRALQRKVTGLHRVYLVDPDGNLSSLQA
jgi:FAD:protein FMN transferase